MLHAPYNVSRSSCISIFFKAQPVMTVFLLMNLLTDISIQSTQQVQCNDVKPGCTVFSVRSTHAVRCNDEQE